MNMHKCFAALLTLCLALVGAVGALAEGGAVNDLLGFYERASAGLVEKLEAEEPEIIYGDEPATETEELLGLEIGDTGLSLEWENILLLGTDSRSTEKNTRTDTMIVLSLNTQTHDIRMTSLMRDIWVDIPGHGGAKLNAACVYGGPELTVQTINENFGLDIQSYVLVNMSCLASIVDGLGGIRIDVSREEAKAINMLFEDDRHSNDANVYFAGDNVSPGSQMLLNGKQALAYARIRSLDSDYARTERQRTLLVTIARKLQQQDLLSLAGIVTGMLQYVETNLTMDDIMAIAGVCLDADLENIAELRLPVEGTYEAGTFGGTWCIRPDFIENARVLNAFIYGD